MDVRFDASTVPLRQSVVAARSAPPPRRRRSPGTSSSSPASPPAMSRSSSAHSPAPPPPLGAPPAPFQRRWRGAMGRLAVLEHEIGDRRAARRLHRRRLRVRRQRRAARLQRLARAQGDSRADRLAGGRRARSAARLHLGPHRLPRLPPSLRQAGHSGTSPVMATDVRCRLDHMGRIATGRPAARDPGPDGDVGSMPEAPAVPMPAFRLGTRHRGDPRWSASDPLAR